MRTCLNCGHSEDLHQLGPSPNGCIHCPCKTFLTKKPYEPPALVELSAAELERLRANVRALSGSALLSLRQALLELLAELDLERDRRAL